MAKNKVKTIKKKYNDWVNKVSDDLPEKTHFSIDEIVEKIVRLTEEYEKQNKNDEE